MVDREKVIKGLECIAQKREPTANPCKNCGYSDRLNYAICVKDIASDALALLKEQDNCECENCAIAIEDWQPVARCKDCKYAHKTYDGDCKYCDMFTDDDGNPIERYRSGDWFCADGERAVKWDG